MGFIVGKRDGFLSENVNLSDIFVRFFEQSQKSFLINRGISYVKLSLFNNWIPDANKRSYLVKQDCSCRYDVLLPPSVEGLSVELECCLKVSK